MQDYKGVRGLKDPFLCIDRKNMDIQEIYSDEVSEYITKVFEPKIEGNIVLLDKDGICNPE